MFWGRGDTSRLGNAERDTLAHLRRLVETEHIIALDAEKAQVALRALDFYEQWESMLRFLNSVKNVGLLVGGLLALYWASQGALAAWVVKTSTGG